MQFFSPKRATVGRDLTLSEITSVPANGTATVTMSGESDNAYGITQLLPYSPSEASVIVKEIEVDGDRVKPWIATPGVRLAALRRLFEGFRLDVPLVIPSGKSLDITFENTSGSSVQAAMTAHGLTHKQLPKRIKQVRRVLGDVPTPRFMYGRQSISADATNETLDLNFDSVRQVFDRLAVAADAGEDALRVQLRSQLDTAMPAAYIPQLNSRFSRGMGSTRPYLIGAQSVFEAQVTNDDSSQHEANLVAITYAADEIPDGYVPEA